MKKLLFLLSLVLLVTWLFSFLALDFTPVVHVILLLSILLFIRAVMTVEEPSNSVMPVNFPEPKTGNN
jgi:hypothetical protein